MRLCSLVCEWAGPPAPVKWSAGAGGTGLNGSPTGSAREMAESNSRVLRNTHQLTHEHEQAKLIACHPIEQGALISRGRQVLQHQHVPRQVEFSRSSA